MKISITESGSKGFTILLPTRLLLCPMLIGFGLKMGRKYSSEVPDISPAAIRELRRVILKAKRRNPDWVLVDVESSDGDKVMIKL